MKKTFPLKRVTIVCADSLRDTLVRELHDLGAKGYTWEKVHGAGARGRRPNAWTGSNVRIEVIATEEAAEEMLEHVDQKYGDGYALIAYLDDVWVLRPERFGTS